MIIVLNKDSTFTAKECTRRPKTTDLFIPEPTTFPSFYIGYALHQSRIRATNHEQCSQYKSQHGKIDIGDPKWLVYGGRRGGRGAFGKRVQRKKEREREKAEDRGVRILTLKNFSSRKWNRGGGMGTHTHQGRPVTYDDEVSDRTRNT